MTNNLTRRNSTANRTLRRIWRRLCNSLIQDVPPELAACEFSCRKLHCGTSEWATCEHRMKLAERSK